MAQDAEWQLPVKSIDLEEFDSASNGESHLPVDGTDTEITIITGSETFSKTNAAGSTTWTAIELWREQNCR